MEDKIICGLVGVIGNIEKAHKDAFRTLLCLDTIRGPHSTGVATINSQGEWDMVKRRGTPWDLFDSREYHTTINKVTYGLIGHNRYATQGKVNQTNAHPFEFEDVVGCHNGTLRGQHRLPEHTRFEVDSENIYYAIQTEGLNATLAKLDGAYALSYWDKRSEDFVLLRNDERTLYYSFTKDGKTMFWASEDWMLHVALGKANIKYGLIQSVDECTIYRFNVERKYNAGPITYTKEKFEEFIPPKKTFPSVTVRGKTTTGYSNSSTATKTLPGKPLPPKLQTMDKKRADFVITHCITSTTGSRCLVGHAVCDSSISVRMWPGTLFEDFWGIKDDTTFNGQMTAINDQTNGPYLLVNTQTAQEVVDEDEDEEDDSQASFLFTGFNGVLLTPDEYDRRVSNGCAFCSDPITREMADDLLWLKHDDVFCPDCAQNEEALALIST